MKPNINPLRIWEKSQDLKKEKEQGRKEIRDGGK